MNTFGKERHGVDEPESTAHRKVLVGWHVLILAILAWVVTRPGDEPLHWIWIPVILTPLLVLASTFAPIGFRTRATLYWVLGLVTVPTALSGITSLIGPLFIISVIMLIWAARRENPSPEMVQI